MALFAILAIVVVCEVAFFISAPIVVYRSIAGLILQNHWHWWYVRRAVDASIVGLIILFAGPMFSLLKPDKHVLEKLKTSLFESHHVRELDVRTLNAYNNFEELINMQWLLDHLVPLVVLPAGIVFMAGYSVERKKHGKSD